MKHMKNYIVLLLIFIGAFTSAQTTNSQTSDSYLGTISLSVTTPDNPDKLNPSQTSKLQTKALAIATRNGIGGVSYSTNFVITPKLDIYDESVAEGMRNITVLTTELTLVIKQASNGLVFSTYSASIKGSGFNKDDALNNAISQINPADPKAKAFIEEGKNKILSFYNSKCNDIISEADKYSGMNNYERALAILMSVPVEATPCHDKIKDKSISVFKLYQKKQCQSQIQLAKSQIAGKQYRSALNTLAFIDPTASCFNESNILMTSAESKLTAEDKRLWEIEREKMKNKMEMEKYQIDAMKSVANSFLGMFGGGGGSGGGGSLISSILGFLF
jgi:hypothetical protein